MRILLTGATGFVGEALVKSLSQNHTLICLSRNGAGEGFVYADLSDNISVRTAGKAIDGNFDALIHLAAFVPKVAAEDRLTVANAINEEGLVNLIDVFGERIKKLILGSTAEVYDQFKITNVIKEDDPLNPGSYYAATKLASEFVARTYGKKNNVPVQVLRFSVMYGPNDPIARALPNFIKAALRNEDIVVKGGAILRDYVHLSDVVQSIHDALDSNNSGVVNIGTGLGVTIKEVAETIVMLSGSRSRVLVESGESGVNIVLNPEYATKLIGYKAKVLFPDRLGEMIDSYR